LWKTLVTGSDFNKIIHNTDSKNIRLFVENNAESFGKLPIDKEIGLRLFVVNVDGTLVDPDGRAFYLKLENNGKAIDFTANVNGVIPTLNTGVAFDSIIANTTFLNGATSEFLKAITSVTLTTSLKFVNAEGESISTPIIIKPVTARGISTTWSALNLTAGDLIVIDGFAIPSSFGALGVSSVTGTIVVRGAENKEIGEYAVTLKRVVDFKPRVDFGKLLDADYLFNLLPTEDGINGTVSLEDVLEGTKLTDKGRLQVIIATGTDTSVSTEKGESTLTLGTEDIAKLLDGELHEASINYNYGYIYSSIKEHTELLSSSKKEGSTTSWIPAKTEIQFLTELQSMTWYLEATEDWTSATPDKLIYKTINTIPLNAFTSGLGETSYVLVDKNGKPVPANGVETYTLVGASILTGESKKVDVYYTITIEDGELVFTPRGTQTLNNRDKHILQLEIQDVFQGVTYPVDVPIIIATR
jgi:hypothetical protein